MKSVASNPSPLLRANVLSRCVHSWVYALLRKSCRQGSLGEKDIYDLPPDFDALALTDQLESNWLDEVKNNPSNPSLIRATVRSLGWTPFLIGLLLIPKMIAQMLQAILVILLMDFFEPCSAKSVWFACYIGIATIFCAFCTSCFYHPYYHTVVMYGVKMRMAYSGLIYRKMLRLSSQAMGSRSSGDITNLLASDAEQIEIVSHFFHFAWMAPLELCVASLVMWYFVKSISLIAVVYTILIIISQLGFGQIFVRLRTKILTITDERVKIISETLKSMRVIKMYCWESSIEKKICGIRRREIIQCAKRLLLDCIQTLFSHTHMPVTLLMIYTTMWLFEMPFDTRLFAILVCIISYMRMWTIDTFNYAIRNLVHYLAARKRIEAFLLLDDCDRDKRLIHNLENSHTLSCDIRLAKWKTDETFALQNISFTARPGDLICVIGNVGSGKSSLLQAIAGEISHFDGEIKMDGTFCYVPQEAWLFSSTLMENVLFGKAYDHQLFSRVTRVAALDHDIQQLKHGLNTSVGDQGVTLAGGQKARVNLARALYRDASIYLLDDPLSAVDVKVSNHIFDQSIRGYLKDKICILATHQVQFLHSADRILVIEQGKLAANGTYDELMADWPPFEKLMEEITQHKKEQIQPANASTQEPNVVPTEEPTDEQPLLPLDESAERIQNGMVNWRIHLAFVRAGVGIIGGIILPLIFVVHQSLAMFSNWWLASWSEAESKSRLEFNLCSNTSTLSSRNTTYMESATDWYQRRNSGFYIYCGIILLLIIASIVRAVLTEFACLNAGRVLHNKMLRQVLRCPIYFFDTTPIGRILNRFAKDTSVIDDALPLTLFDFLQNFFQVIGTMILVGWLNPWSFIPAGVALIGMLLVRSRFAPCSRDLKRLEGVTRSPIYSYLASSIQGVKVIRSYRAEKMCSDQFLSHVVINTRVSYLLITINRWAAFRFDWITAGFIACITFLAICMRVLQNWLSAADIALTLSYSLSLMGLVQWCIRLSVDTETLMTAAERVLEYCALDQEPIDVAPPRRPLPETPSSFGEITFENVLMHHSPDAKSLPALRHITLKIHSAEKIGIIGRTGAGKSSFIQALFRMGTLTEGRILIDGVDIAALGLTDLRSRVSVIPQDPVLFTGSVKSNLDPFGRYSDDEIMAVLDQVQLKAHVIGVMPNGLQSPVSGDGTTMSMGQRQLLCLGRAILKRSKILVIDEATAHVDNETDALIQQTIRDKFQDLTVLTVAHRLRTVIDSDRILVLGDGEVLEFDTPANLRADPNSHLSLMMRQMENVETDTSVVQH